MYILRFIFIGFLFFSLKGNAQFNTVLAKPEPLRILPVLASDNNRAEIQEEKEVKINDALEGKRTQILNQRRYVSLPIDTVVVTSGYGKRNDPFTGKLRFHSGIDLYANNNYVYSIMPGRIIKAGKNKALGNYVEIRHGDFQSIYGHLQQVLVSAKQNIEAGQPIGISGNSGRSTGEHLHFALKYLNKFINPSEELNYITSILDSSKIQIQQAIKDLKK